MYTNEKLWSGSQTNSNKHNNTNTNNNKSNNLILHQQQQQCKCNDFKLSSNSSNSGSNKNSLYTKSCTENCLEKKSKHQKLPAHDKSLPNNNTIKKDRECTCASSNNDCDNCMMNEDVKIMKDAVTTTSSPVKNLASPKIQKTSPLTSPKIHQKLPKESPSVSPKLREDNLSPKIKSDQLLSPSKPAANRVLEKSNSLGESKPQKQLRTTKSLSPRPPMKHQHAIMVSDENDIVSVKVSPNDDFDDVFNKTRKNSGNVDSGKFSASDNSSPSVLSDSGMGSLKLDDRHLNNNRSTSCLVYVPSDPWTKMTEDLISDGTENKSKGQEVKIKKPLEVKSLSRPSLNDDPWVWRDPAEEGSGKKGNGGKSAKKPAGYRQSRQMLAKLEENNKKLCQQMKMSPNNKSMPQAASSSLGRPRLQRCKSPSLQNEDGKAEKTNRYKKKRPANLNPIPNSHQQLANNMPTSPLSLSPKTLSLSPTLGYRSVPDTNFGAKTTSPHYLNISNPNLMQPRHSFSSTLTTKNDDELQLNIRRLSEQMKYTNYFASTTTTIPGPASMRTDFPSVDVKKMTLTKEQPQDKKTNLKGESLLETTC